MTCFNPMIRVEDRSKWQTATDGHKYHPAIIYNPPKEEMLEEFIERNKNMLHRAKWQVIPCGRCTGCRLDYSKEWANRGYLEAKQHKENWFVTLTYDDIHMPKNEFLTENWERSYHGTLDKKDLQAFVKILRQEIARKFQRTYLNWKRNGEKEGECPEEPHIKVMGCGEYGEHGQRPHYHVIIFGLHLEPETFYNAKFSKGNCYWQNTVIEKCWKKGISNISEASWNNIAYVARYITKKIKGKEAGKYYEQMAIEPEYMMLSKGIGEKYYEKNKDKIYKNDNIIIKNKKGAITQKPPKYYDKKYKKENPEKYEKLQRIRAYRAERQAQFNDLKTSLNRMKQKEIQEEYKKESTQKLIRNMEAQ